MIKNTLSRAPRDIGDTIGSPARLTKSVLAMIAKDRGFGFWWLVFTIAIALTIGLLVALVLSPVIGLLAALIAGIWMLVRRSRSARSGQTAEAQSAS